jgi:hypothetical protein
VRENRTQGSVRGRSGNWPFYLDVRQAQLGASYRVPYPCIKVGSPNRAKLNQQPVPSVARLAESDT